MCENVCQDEITCSGHGQCEPNEGKTCKCDKGWETEAKYIAQVCLCIFGVFRKACAYGELYHGLTLTFGRDHTVVVTPHLQLHSKP
jgi:hypothetical protein